MLKRLYLFVLLFFVIASSAFADEQNQDFISSPIASADVKNNTTSQSILANLPPDPGAAGKATLAGIDSDGDGVRDDVQRWIALTYPNSQKTRAALTQMAKAKQVILLGAADVASARTNADNADNAAYCLTYAREQILGLAGSDAYSIKGELRAIYLNTLLRTKTWLQHDSHLGGMFFTVPADLKQGCSFNPDLMAN